MCFLQFHHFPQLIPRQLQHEGRHRFPRIERTRRSGPSNTNVSLNNGVRFTQIFCVSVTEGSFASAFRPVRSSQILHFFGDLILDLLQAAWAPSPRYLSSVSRKLMGCNCMNCLSLIPGTASETWAGVSVLSQVNLATAALTACNGYALTPECLFLMSFFHCFVFSALFSIRQS